jgi:hypothetical protein
MLTEEKMLERYFTVQEIADSMQLSCDTVRELVYDLPGVIKISNPRLIGKRKRAPRVVLRVPLSALARLQQDRGGGTLKIEKRRGVV